MDYLLEWLVATWRTVGWVLSLDGRIADPLVSLPSAEVDAALGPALGVLLWATLSIGLGHAGVLYLNLVPAKRLFGTFLTGLVVVLALRTLEALALWAIAWLFTGELVRPLVIIIIGLLALAPQVFAVLTALPHVGLFIGRLLSVWEAAVLFVLVTAVYRVSPWLGLAVVAVAWVFLQLASRLLAGPLQTLMNRVFARASGRPVMLTPQDLLDGAPFVPVEAAKES